MFKFLNTVKTQTLDPKQICLDHMNGNIVYTKHECFFSDLRKHNFSHEFVCTLLPSYILTYHPQTQHTL